MIPLKLLSLILNCVGTGSLRLEIVTEKMFGPELSIYRFSNTVVGAPGAQWILLDTLDEDNAKLLLSTIIRLKHWQQVIPQHFPLHTISTTAFFE